MKYFITFIMMFFIGIVAFSIDVSAFSFQQADVDDVPYMKSQVALSVAKLQEQTGHTENYIILLCYTSSSNYSICKCSYNSNTTVTLYKEYYGTCSPKYAYEQRIFSGNPTTISNSNWNGSQTVPNFDTGDNYLLLNTVPVSFNNTIYDPPPTIQGDTFFVTKENFTMNFGVFAGPGSEYVQEGNPNNFYRTKKYTVNVEFTYNNSTVVYTIPNYLNWAYKYNTVVQTEEIDNILDYVPKFTFYAEPYYNTSMQAIRVPVISEPVLVNIGFTFETMTDYRSFNQITFAQLKAALSTDYPDLTINDLYTELHFKFYDENNTLCYDGVNDYSSLKNSGVEPEPDPYVTNLTETTETLNNYINSNNRYLKDIMYGDTYIPAPYERTAKDAGNINLDLISVPDYTYQHQQLDSDATTFFGRMVEWWYLDSPFGIIAIVALTFLVIRTIIW